MTMGLSIVALRRGGANVDVPSPRPSPTCAFGPRERETLGAILARSPSPAAKPWEREGTHESGESEGQFYGEDRRAAQRADMALSGEPLIKDSGHD